MGTFAVAFLAGVCHLDRFLVAALTSAVLRRRGLRPVEDRS